MISDQNIAQIVTIGFGEAASAFATGWGGNIGGDVTAFDIAVTEPAQAEALRARCAAAGVSEPSAAANCYVQVLEQAMLDLTVIIQAKTRRRIPE